MKPKYSLLLLFVTFVYFAAGELGLSQALIHTNVSPVWPATGVGIVAVWYFGYAVWPAILAGSFLVNALTTIPIGAAAGIAAGSTLEALAAVFLLRRIVGSRNPFNRVHDTVTFLLVAGAVGPAFSATIGSISLCMSGSAPWEQFAALWLTWWLGDAVGAVVVGPFFLTWLESTSPSWTRRQWAEAVLLLASMSLVGAIVFAGWFAPGRGTYPLEHLIVPFLVWAGFRLAPRGASTAITVLAIIATAGTGGGLGPFEAYGEDALLLLQIFIIAVAVTTLVLGAIVAERRNAEEALRSKETQLRLITDVIPVGLTQCDKDLRYTFVNHAYADMFGLLPDQIIGKTVLEVIGRDACEVIRPYVERTLDGHSVQYEAEVPYQHAGRRFMRIAYMPHYGEGGAVVGWIAAITDISDRKRAEERSVDLNAELQRRIQDFQALIDTAPVGIGVAMDPECKFIWSNREFRHMLGVDKEVNISKSGPMRAQLPFKVYRRDAEVPAGELPMQRACREGREVMDEELEIIRGDGTIVPQLCRATPLLDEQDKVRGCIGVFVNITERKQAERERERLLTREKEAREEAESANRIKDEFLAVISHELRTPLNSILGWAQLLRGGTLDSTVAAHALETIERNSKTQARLIDDLLDVSRIISGKLRLDIKPTELISVVEAAVDSLRHAIDAKGIQLDTNLDPAASHIKGDPTRLQQVVWNLLSNAVKFTGKGGRIEIRLTRKGTDTQLTVTDSGEGINPEFLPYVFDRFRQEDSSRTRKHGGLGLGLAIVRHLTEIHGGMVEAFSAGENRGSSFTVRLPLAAQISLVENTTSNRQVETGDALPNLSGTRVLIVEDNRDSLDMLRVVVSSSGAEVKTAISSEEALHVIDEWIPDVLISDIGLPDEDGYTLIGKIRRLLPEPERHIPAIALTGYAGVQEVRRARASGFQMYLTKPAEPAKLVKAVARLASRGEIGEGASV
jgi:PAS domain S-box-containing protein